MRGSIFGTEANGNDGVRQLDRVAFPTGGNHWNHSARNCMVLEIKRAFSELPCWPAAYIPGQLRPGCRVPVPPHVAEKLAKKDDVNAHSFSCAVQALYC